MGHVSPHIPIHPASICCLSIHHLCVYYMYICTFVSPNMPLLNHLRGYVCIYFFLDRTQFGMALVWLQYWYPWRVPTLKLTRSLKVETLPCQEVGPLVGDGDSGPWSGVLGSDVGSCRRDTRTQVHVLAVSCCVMSWSAREEGCCQVWPLEPLDLWAKQGSFPYRVTHPQKLHPSDDK